MTHSPTKHLDREHSDPTSFQADQLLGDCCGNQPVESGRSAHAVALGRRNWPAAFGCCAYRGRAHLRGFAVGKLVTRLPPRSSERAR